ncbi:WLM domain-containing protein [Paraphoma chrysanthemicola]|uniref:WLM domain-containing protein n=1 Tax=Paraphoma chrysanthemicola TaxID=798071 RepID=A0A8K0RF42_9PLEO|nr:WLM domain-containing protein [Paraphoma chrysanthemicola]
MAQQQPKKISSELASSAPEFRKFRNIYKTHELPDAHKSLDGKFTSYSTLKYLPDEEKALKLLRTLACIVQPVMSHHKIVAHALHERIYDGECDIIAINYVRKDDQGTYIRSADTGLYTSIVLSITLRRHKDPSKFYTLEELLDILCHELAHCWHVGHKFNFHLQWASLVVWSGKLKMTLVGSCKLSVRIVILMSKGD